MTTERPSSSPGRSQTESGKLRQFSVSAQIVMASSYVIYRCGMLSLCRYFVMTDTFAVDQWLSRKRRTYQWWRQHRNGWRQLWPTDRICAFIRPARLVVPAHRRRDLPMYQPDNPEQRHRALRHRCIPAMGRWYQCQLYEYCCTQQYDKQPDGEQT